MTDKGEVPPIILTTKERHTTWNNRDFEVAVWNRSNNPRMDIRKFDEMLTEKPILYTGKVRIEFKNKTVESKGEITILLAHGKRDEQEVHLVYFGERQLKSFDVVNAIVRDREKSGNPERIKLFVSCDENGATERWDEGPLGAMTGVIGFSGGINIIEFDNEGIIIDAKGIDGQELRTPFNDPNSPNAWMTDPRYSDFIVTELKL